MALAPTTSEAAASHSFGPQQRDASRRTVLRGAAWTVPAVTLAVGSPAFAVSTASCPASAGHFAMYAGIAFDGLTTDRRWQTGSTATLTVRIGRRVGDTADSPDQPGFGLWASRNGLTATTSLATFQVTLPYPVSGWTTTSAGWTVAGTGTTHTFTPAVVHSPIPLGTTPTTHTGAGVVVDASGLFVASIAPQNFTNGELVMGRTYAFTPNFQYAWQVSGADCATVSQNYTWTTPVSVTPEA